MSLLEFLNVIISTFRFRVDGDHYVLRDPLEEDHYFIEQDSSINSSGAESIHLSSSSDLMPA